MGIECIARPSPLHLCLPGNENISAIISYDFTSDESRLSSIFQQLFLSGTVTSSHHGKTC